MRKSLSVLLFAATLIGLDWPMPGYALAPNRQLSQYVHDAWSASDGLPSTVIWEIRQTGDGYLWVATQNGLARFDGERFTVFNSSTSPDFPNDDVRAIYPAADGSLWVGTYGGGVLRYRDGRFTTYTVSDGFANNVVYDITQDRTGAIWFATGNGLSRFSDGRFENYTAKDGLASNRVYRVLADSHGNLWAGTLAGGLSRFRDGAFTNFTTGDGLVSNQIHALYEDPEGRVWVGTYHGGLYKMEDGRPVPVEVPPEMAGEGIESILQDSDGNLWLGTYGNGLIRWRDGTARHLAVGDQLTDGFVFSLLEGREGALWIATRDGMNRLHDGKFLLYGKPEGIADTTFVTYQDDAGTVWIGTEGQGLYGLKPDGGIEHVTDDDGLSSNSVSALSGDGRGSLWVGTFGGGLDHLVEGRVNNVLTSADGLASNLVFALQETGDGTLWISADGGLSRYRQGQVRTYTPDDGLPDPLVRCIQQSGDGTLWLGTNGGGLAHLVDGEFQVFTKADGLASNLIYALHEDADGTLWIGTRSSGLSRYRDGAFTSYGVGQGLTDASVYRILEDGAARLWLSGAGGLMRIDKRQFDELDANKRRRLEPEFYGQDDGMRSSQFSGGFQPAGWKTRDGRLWFPTGKGLVVVDPDHMPRNDQPPPVYIESVIADGVPQSTDRPVHLAPRVGNLEIHYTALSLLAPDEDRFRYRLSGFDTVWVEAGNRRTAFYTGLPPGDFTFQVMASNNDGIWNESGASIDISHAPRFYQTPWFYAFCVVAASLFVVLGHRLRVRQLRARHDRLSRLVAERTQQLEQALAQVERLSRIDGLTGVGNRRYFEETLDREWQRASREDRSMSVVLVDLDRFKELNDHLGHQQGDDCLRQVAAALQASLSRPGDLLARYGGEEFIALLPDTQIEGAVAIAERMRQRVQAAGIAHGYSDVADVVTISAGAASRVPTPGTTPGELVGMADRALYRAKSEGRNRVCAYRES